MNLRDRLALGLLLVFGVLFTVAGFTVDAADISVTSGLFAASLACLVLGLVFGSGS